MAVKLGNGNWAVKEDKLLAYNDNSGLFFNKEFDFSRGTSATYVAKDGLIKTAGIQPNIVNNGDFSELGSELVTNGTFDTDSDWSKGAGWTISGGKAVATNTSSFFKQNSVVTNNKIYKVTFNATVDSGRFRLVTTADAGTYTSYITADGSYTFYMKPTVSINGGFEFVGDGYTGTIDNVSVKQVDPNDYWTLGTGWSISEGKAINDGSQTGNSLLQQASILTLNKLYKVSYDLTVDSGTIYIRLGFGGQGASRTTSGSYTEYVTCSGNTNFDFLATSTYSGSVDNVTVQEIQTDTPRIDFTNDTKGHLLLEPSRTNLTLNSNDLTESTWSKFNSSTLNSDIVNPEGSTGASLYVCNNYTGSNQYFRINPNTTYSNDVNYTYSMFVKYNTFQFCKLSYMNFSVIEHFTAVFDIINGTVTATDSDGTPQNTSANIQDFGNGWFRISISAAITSSSGNAMNFEFNKSPSGTPTFTSFGRTSQTTTTDDKIYVYGVQLEEGSYATSYIPTTGATSTRNADVCNNSGSAQDFNSEEGVLYAEIAALADDSTYRQIAISDGTTDNRIALMYTNASNSIRSQVRVSASNQFDQTTTAYTITENNKIAIKYKANDFALWINGVQVFTDTSGTTPTGLDELAFDDGAGNNDFYGKVRNVQVFTEALTDEQLEKLTS